MAIYTPGHSAVLAYALETGTVTESADGVTPAALPTIPASPIIIGYSNVPEVVKGLGNKKGYGLAARALYDVKGRQTYSISFEVRVGALGFIQKAIRDLTTDVLPRFALFVGVKGQYTEVIRFCAIDNLALSFQEGEARELTATVRIEGIALQSLGTPLSPTVSQLKAFGNPLTWNNVRQLTIAGTSYRQALMGFNASLANKLERKGDRPDWGDAEPTSRTNYDLLPHTVEVSGEAMFHDRLTPALLNGAINAQRWGDVVITSSDATAIPSGTAQFYEVTLKNVVPVTATDSGVEASAQKSNRVAVLADDILINLVAP